MRLMLAVLALLAWLTIYCNSAVLSLPPSLIADEAAAAAAATAFSRQQTRPPARNSNDHDRRDDHDERDHDHDREKDTQFLLEPRHVVAGLFDGIGQSHSGRASSSSGSNNNNIPIVAGVEPYVRPAISASATTTAAAAKAAHQERQQQHQLELDLNRRKLATAAAAAAAQYDLSALLAASSGVTNNARDSVSQQRRQKQRQRMQQQRLLQQQRQEPSGKLLPPEIAPRIRADDAGPLKYWPRPCQVGDDGDCPAEYYRALFAAGGRNRNNAAAAKHLDQLATATSGSGGVDAGYLGENLDYRDDSIELAADIDSDDAADERSAASIDDDILMLLNGEQELIKFLHWAMEQLYPYQKFANYSETAGGADRYHPGMYIWKKLNLSGRLEPPLLVDEPHYIIVRREQLQEDLQTGSKYSDDPFIPPRGRKHNLPNLESLLHRSDPFMPNRGRRDKIKDIFKYDDLFYPNRGKKQKPPAAAATTTTAATAATITAAATPRNMSRTSDDCRAIATSYDDNDEDDRRFDGFEWYEGAADAFEPPADDSVAATSRVSRRNKALKMCVQQRNAAAADAAAADSRGDGDADDDDRTAAAAAGNENRQTNEIGNGYGDDEGNDDGNNNYKWLQGMPAFKMYDYDQSVRATATAAGEMPSPGATKSSAQRQGENRQLMNARQRRVAGSGPLAAANRFQSTRSMSVLAQQHQQRQQQRYRQQQRQLKSSRYGPQQLYTAQPFHQQQRRQQRRLSTRQYYANRQRKHIELEREQEREQRARHRQQVKLLANLDVDPLLWRQLQFMPQQPEQQQQQPQQQLKQHLRLSDRLLGPESAHPLETELATYADDIDYVYFTDSN